MWSHRPDLNSRLPAACQPARLPQAPWLVAKLRPRDVTASLLCSTDDRNSSDNHTKYLHLGGYKSSKRANVVCLIKMRLPLSQRGGQEEVISLRNKPTAHRLRAAKEHRESHLEHPNWAPQPATRGPPKHLDRRHRRQGWDKADSAGVGAKAPVLGF